MFIRFIYLWRINKAFLNTKWKSNITHLLGRIYKYKPKSGQKLNWNAGISCFIINIYWQQGARIKIDHTYVTEECEVFILELIQFLRQDLSVILNSV